METDIENLVAAAVGGECIAVVSDNAVDVVVGEDRLDDASVLRIHEIVSEVCGNSYENVRISAAK